MTKTPSSKRNTGRAIDCLTTKHPAWGTTSSKTLFTHAGCAYMAVVKMNIDITLEKNPSIKESMWGVLCHLTDESFSEVINLPYSKKIGAANSIEHVVEVVTKKVKQLEKEDVKKTKRSIK